MRKKLAIRLNKFQDKIVTDEEIEFLYARAINIEEREQNNTKKTWTKENSSWKKRKWSFKLLLESMNLGKNKISCF